MKRLFVVHTQYNLILATGMAAPSDDLILFTDFELSAELRARLENHFEWCLFLCGCYPRRELSMREKSAKIDRDCHTISNFIVTPYDEILIVDDMCIPEMYALKCAHRLNSRVEMSWLEDGSSAYYSNDVVSCGMGSTRLKRLIRRAYFSARYRLGGFYDLGDCIGSHKCLNRAYLTFPTEARAELESKARVAITDEEFRRGIGVMYGGGKIPLDDGCIVVALDKLSVYGDRLPTVNRELRKLVAAAKSDGRKLYVKYHPRETDRLKVLDTAEELDSKLAIERYLASSTAESMTVVGVMSTSLMTARKLGYGAVSLAESVGLGDDVKRFYRHIGIDVR